MTESVKNVPIGEFGETVRVYDNGYGFFSVDLRGFKCYMEGALFCYEKSKNQEAIRVTKDIIEWCDQTLKGCEKNG